MPVYPALPGRRMAYDRDGSVGFRHKAGDSTITVLTTGQLEDLNDESDASYYDPSTGADNIYVGILFPELRDLSSYFIYVHSGYLSSLHLLTSVDTTNGYDGTWVDQGTYTNSPGATQPNYRSGIITPGSAYSGIKAIKFGAGYSSNAARYGTIHLFGDITSGQTPNRLRLWHPTLNQEVDGDHFNFNDAGRSTLATKTFRVKNNSSSLTANTITLVIEALTDTTPVMADDFTLDVTSISSLAAAAISSVITMTRNTPSNADLGLWAARVVAAAANWT